jgi:hypothetical protein
MIENYRRAMKIAYIAMGSYITRRRGVNKTVWRADKDPLAWWCLVELILSFRRPL